MLTNSKLSLSDYKMFVKEYEQNRSIFETPMFLLLLFVVFGGYLEFLYHLIFELKLYGLAIVATIVPIFLIAMPIACYGVFIQEAERTLYKTLFYEYFLKDLGFNFIPSCFSNMSLVQGRNKQTFDSKMYAYTSAATNWQIAGKLNRRQQAVGMMLSEKVRYKIQETFNSLNKDFKIIEASKDVTSVSTNLKYNDIDIYDVSVNTIKNLLVLAIILILASAFILFLAYVGTMGSSSNYSMDFILIKVYLPVLAIILIPIIPFIVSNSTKPVNALVLSKNSYSHFAYNEAMADELKNLLNAKQVRIYHDQNNFIIFIELNKGFFDIMNTFYFYGEKRIADFLSKINNLKSFIDKHDIR